MSCGCLVAKMRPGNAQGDSAEGLGSQKTAVYLCRHAGILFI